MNLPTVFMYVNSAINHLTFEWICATLYHGWCLLFNGLIGYCLQETSLQCSCPCYTVSHFWESATFFTANYCLSFNIATFSKKARYGCSSLSQQDLLRWRMTTLLSLINYPYWEQSYFFYQGQNRVKKMKKNNFAGWQKSISGVLYIMIWL